MSDSPTRRQCGICDSERNNVVNAFLASGRSLYWIEAEMKRLGTPTKAETVGRHLEGCLGGQRSNSGLLVDAATGAAVSANADFAQAVRAEANRMLKAGELKINANHGLNAQAMIDRRAERAADRQLMVEMAGLLSGSRSPVPADMIVVGEWQPVPTGLPLHDDD